VRITSMSQWHPAVCNIWYIMFQIFRFYWSKFWISNKTVQYYTLIRYKNSRIFVTLCCWGIYS
jgi:hypothetical protein